MKQIQQVYNCNQRVFAENRVQPLLERKEALPQDIKWHLIGHLQLLIKELLSEMN